MRFFCSRIRMAMTGTFYAYDVYIFSDDVKNPGNYFIYPAGINSPKCVPLYAYFKGNTDTFKLNLLKMIFPELKNIKEVPFLWIDLLGEDLQHENAEIHLSSEEINSLQQRK